MRTKSRRSLRALVAGTVATAAVALVATIGSATAATTPSVKLMSVNLASVTGPSTGVGQGILYGITADGTQPTDEYLKPLHLNSFRGGGWYAGGWVKDGYSYGTAMKEEIATIIAQGQRLQKMNGKKFQYQVLLSDLFGSTGGLPASTTWPCTNGDCSNWTTMIDDVIGALKGAGVNFAYDIWNEPDGSEFWAPGVNTPQYFQMWDSAYAEIRKDDPTAKIVGPSFANTPTNQPNEWQTWIQHVRTTGTVPDMITTHDESDNDDPVTVGQVLTNDLRAGGLKALPLSANEYQPADRQTAGVTAWYLDRFAQSDYTNAMRGNWQCCMIPNATGLLSLDPTGWAPSGNWWAMKTYADMTGSLVATSGEVGTTAITAAKDASKNQAVALVGDDNGYTGDASVTFVGISSAKYLEKGGMVHATVYRIPDQGTLYSPPVVFSQDVPVTNDSITVPFTFQSAHDAFGIYLSQEYPQTIAVQGPATLTAPGSFDVPVTLTNASDVADTNVKLSLAVSAATPADAAGITVTCDAGKTSTCPAVAKLPAGKTLTSNFTVTVPASAPKVSYRLTGSATAQLPDGTKITPQNSADIISPCDVGDTCEAETGTLAGGAVVATDHTGYTGSGFVAGFTSPGGSVTQQFSVPTAGTYTLDLRYAAGSGGPNQTRSATVSLNGTAQGQIQLPLTANWDTWGDATMSVQLNAGLNSITVSHLTTDLGWFNLDSFKLTQ